MPLTLCPKSVDERLGPLYRLAFALQGRSGRKTWRCSDSDLEVGLSRRVDVEISQTLVIKIAGHGQRNRRVWDAVKGSDGSRKLGVGATSFVSRVADDLTSQPLGQLANGRATKRWEPMHKMIETERDGVECGKCGRFDITSTWWLDDTIAEVVITVLQEWDPPRRSYGPQFEARMGQWRPELVLPRWRCAILLRLRRATKRPVCL
ncbi:hypothetical protein BN2475_910009 [Paraburkholderia ribeironis]|uniref:Uncharacterized protein n=1 Tax=Paraburkholderia ribeironis TaxID=1247936 RepID=A0A1N7SM23_9BURK|nr:hypothetical protein BN2475_910009 [Paraburkholderia ribeironis]